MLSSFRIINRYLLQRASKLVDEPGNLSLAKLMYLQFHFLILIQASQVHYSDVLNQILHYVLPKFYPLQSLKNLERHL